MDKADNSRKAKQCLALALASAFLLVNAVSSTPPVHAYFIGAPVSVIVNSASYGTLGSYNVVKANLSSAWPFSPLSLVVFAVWKNNDGQTVSVSTGGLTLAQAATGMSFVPLTNALSRGMYTVQVFVITTGNNPVSSTLSFVVII